MRQDTAGPASRNKVSTPQGGDYVLPAPPRGALAPLVTSPEESTTPSSGGGEVARAIGARLGAQVDSLDMFLAELRDRLEQLDHAIAEDSRAQLKGAVREIGHVVDWWEASQQALRADSARAAAGEEPVDLVALSEQVAAAVAGAEPVTVLVHQPVTCWGHRARFRELLTEALALVSARTNQRGLRCIELEWREGAPSVRVCSRGEPGGDIAPELVERFRSAAARSGAVVEPDGHGVGGAGLVLRLEAAADATAI